MKKVLSMLLCICFLVCALPQTTAEAATIWQPLYEAEWPDFYDIVNLDEYPLFEDMVEHDYVFVAKISYAEYDEVYRIYLANEEDSVRLNEIGIPAINASRLLEYDVVEIHGELVIIGSSVVVADEEKAPGIPLQNMVGTNTVIDFESHPTFANLHWDSFGKYFAYVKKDIPSVYELTNSVELYEKDSVTSPWAFLTRYKYFIVTYDEAVDKFTYYGTDDLPTTDFLDENGNEVNTPRMHIASDNIGYFEVVNATGGYRAENNQVLATTVHIDMRSIVGSNYDYATEKFQLNNLLRQNYRNHDMAGDFPVWSFARIAGAEELIDDIGAWEYITISYFWMPSGAGLDAYTIVLTENKPEAVNNALTVTGATKTYSFMENDGSYTCMVSEENYDTLSNISTTWDAEYTNYEYEGLDYFAWKGNNFSFVDTTEGDMIIDFTMNCSEVNIVVPLTVECYINPNTEESFVYGDLTVTNNSVAPVKVFLQSFEQKSGDKTFLLPDGLSSIQEDLTWDTLNVEQSKKYYSVGLRPLADAETWYRNLAPDYLYVGALPQKTALGVVYPDVTAQMEIDAHHGRCFDTADSFTLQVSFIAEFCAD